MSDVTIELCVQKHADTENRIETLDGLIKETRSDMKSIEKSYSDNLQRIYDRIEEISKRPPIWATTLITIMGALCTGLAVAMSK